jgi:hypothetical protein
MLASCLVPNVTAPPSADDLQAIPSANSRRTDAMLSQLAT